MEQVDHHYSASGVQNCQESPLDQSEERLLERMAQWHPETNHRQTVVELSN